MSTTAYAQLCMQQHDYGRRKFGSWSSRKYGSDGWCVLRHYSKKLRDEVCGVLRHKHRHAWVWHVPGRQHSAFLKSQVAQTA